MGLDYFPFDVDTFQDIKIRKLIKYQGGKAITIYALLLCFIYKDGYYMRWDKELPFIISEQTGFEEVYISEVIKNCLTLGLLSKELFDTEQILTSKGIQERYRDICKQMKRKCDFSEFSLISSETSEENGISSEKMGISSEEKPINSAKSTQKKRKGKYIDFPSGEEKSSFPSNEEKASNSHASEVQDSGNGGFGGSSETLAAEADSANGFANPSDDALVGEAAPDDNPVIRECESGDFPKENPQPDKILTTEDECSTAGKKTANPEALPQEKIPYQEIVDMFNSICTGYSRVMKLSDARKNKIRIRVEEMGGFAKAKPIIQTIFEKMQASNFLRGDNRRGWKAYFDWIFENGKNWVKILEGNYDNRISNNETTTTSPASWASTNGYARPSAGDKAASREAVGQFARAVLEKYKSQDGD